MDNQIDITANNYAEVSFGGNSLATDTTGGFKKIEVGSPAFQIQMYGFTFTENKVIYQGQSRAFKITFLALVCHEGSQVERELRITVYKNGNPIDATFGKVSSTGSAIFKAASYTIEANLAEGDVLEAMVSNSNGTEKVTVRDIKLTIVSK